MRWTFFSILTLFLSLNLSSCSTFSHKGLDKQKKCYRVCKKCKRCKKHCQKCAKKKQKKEEQSRPQ